MNTEKVPAKDLQEGDRVQTLSAGICTVTSVKDAQRSGYLAVTFKQAETSYIPLDYPVKRVVD